MDCKTETILYEGKKVRVYDILRERDIDTHKYLLRRRKGLSIEESLYECLNPLNKDGLGAFTDSKSFVYDELIQRGMPAKYQSLKQFCVVNFMDYSSFLGILRRHPEYTFAQAYQYYFYLATPIKGGEFQAFGISLKAICLKFQLDYEFCRSRISSQPDVPVEEILVSSLLHSPIFPASVAERLYYFQEQLQQIPTCQVVDWCQSLHFDNEFIRYAFLYRRKVYDIQSSFKIYEKVYFLENGWEELYGEEIHHLHQDSPNTFFEQYNQLKHTVWKRYFEEWQMDESDLHSYYQEYYNDYVKFLYEGDSCWGYRRIKKQDSK